MAIKDILSQISKKSFIGALLFAIALWLYTTLSGNYTTMVNLPLVIELPVDRAFEVAPPEYITVETKGTGWNLFNLLFFNNAKKITLNLSNNTISENEYPITRQNLIKGAQALERVELSDVLTDNLILYTDKIATYTVEVEPNMEINPSEGFIVVGQPKITPNMIEIRGNDKIVREIKSWKTKFAVFDDVNKSFSSRIELSDSLSGILTVNQKYVNFSSNVQQTAEITFEELPINIRGGVMPNNYKLYPNFITLTFRGGIDDIIDLSPNNINIILNYADILNDDSGVLIPQIEYPENLELIEMKPKYLMNLRIVRSNSLVNL